MESVERVGPIVTADAIESVVPERGVENYVKTA